MRHTRLAFALTLFFASTALAQQPQPATTFSDNNGTEVVKVEQQGTGKAITATSPGTTTVRIENSNYQGVALDVAATSQSGGGTAIRATGNGNNSPALVLQNDWGPLVDFKGYQGAWAMTIDASGNLITNGQVTADKFYGDGSLLWGIQHANHASTADIAYSYTNYTVEAEHAANADNATWLGGYSHADFLKVMGDKTIFGDNILTGITTFRNMVNFNNQGMFNANDAIYTLPFHYISNLSAACQGGDMGLASGQDGSSHIYICPLNEWQRLEDPNSYGNSLNASNLTSGTVAIARGGTGLSAAVNGALVGNGTSYSAQSIASVNSANAIVARDASGNFSAGVITASLNGNATSATTATTATTATSATSATSANTANALANNPADCAAGLFATAIDAAGNLGCSAIPNLSTTATSANTNNAIVARDASGNFSAGTITANLSGNTSGTHTGGLNVTGGVGADGSGLKHKRVAACATANSAGSTCDVTVTWTTAFADTNYTPSCTLGFGTAAPSGKPSLIIQAKTASSVTVRVIATENGVAGGTTAQISCIAIHD